MVSILEAYMLTCTACGKKKKVSRLHVDGNLGEIERTWVCPDCQRQGREPAGTPAEPAEAAD